MNGRIWLLTSCPESHFHRSPSKISASSFVLHYIISFSWYIFLSLSATYVRLCGCRNRRPSGSCSGGRRRLCRRTVDRCRTVLASECRSCKGRIDRNNRGGRTSVRHIVPDTATIFPHCIPGTGSLRKTKVLG